jgi:hypothetical protein
VIGECKSHHGFNQHDLTNLLRVSTCFRDTEVDIYIVFSKLARFADVELKLIRDQVPDVRQKIVLLDAEALESEQAFQATKITILDIERLARASAMRFDY